MKLGLVLGVGGSRGAYQVGAVKALKELGIKFDIGTGASAGSINICLVAQDRIPFLEDIWRNLNFEKVFEKKLKWKNKENEVFVKSLFTNGYSVEPLRDLIREHITNSTMKNAIMKVGVVYSTGRCGFYKYHGVEFSTELKTDYSNYVIASSGAFPFLKKHKINNQNAFDGFYTDSLPIKLAVDMGAEKIFAIELMKGHRMPFPSETKVYYLHPSKKHQYMFNFDNNHLNELVDRGYNDVMAQKEEILKFFEEK